MSFSSCHQIALPFSLSVEQLAAALANQRHFVWFDSASSTSEESRYHLMAFEPEEWVEVSDYNTLVFSNTGETRKAVHWREYLQQSLSSFEIKASHLPFSGGYLGYLSYDLGKAELLPAFQSETVLAEFGLFLSFILVDKQSGEASFVLHPRCPNKGAKIDHLFQLLRASVELQPTNIGPLETQVDYHDYAQQFQAIQRYLREGDVYQVNYARRFTARFSGSAFSAYQWLRKAFPAPFGAYMAANNRVLLSNSPERFLRFERDLVVTQPIKGTCERGADEATDQALKTVLLNSEKNRAENLMIVDLMRNDLGKYCVAGSVVVDKLFEVQSFPSVHHLVSTISARLKPTVSAIDVLVGALPGGSITGAPKKRAVEVIDEIEAANRGVYCGSIFYLSCCGKADSNITIRTAVIEHGKMEFWSGGGIVADSDCREEFEETRHKAKAFFALAEYFG